MSKSTKLMAGLGIVAALGVMVPAAGVSAATTDSQVDTLKVNITPNCTFGYTSTTHPELDVARGEHTNGLGTWSNNTGGNTSPVTSAGETLEGTMENGTTNDNFGSTKLNVVCNNLGGWQVKATATDLTTGDGGTGKTISPAADHSATKSGWSWKVTADTPGTGETPLTVPEGKQGATADGGSSVATVAEATSATGRNFTVTYGVGIQGNQASGTYQGTMTYSLAQL